MNKNLLLFLLSLGIAIQSVFAQQEEPLLTIGCISDIHTERSLVEVSNLDDIALRGSFSMAVNKIRQQEKIDVLVMGGDQTSDANLTPAAWERTRQVIAEEARRAFPEGSTRTPVLYVAGNHEFEVANWDNIPKSYNAGDFYTYPMRDDVGELSADDAFYEEADNGDQPKPRLLAAYHYEIKGFHFVALNCGKYFFRSAWDYQYSIESVRWVAAKLEEICKDDPLKTVFFLIHVPFGDSNSLSAVSKGMVEGAASKLLKSTLAKYPNLIMLYGHDHGKDTGYSRTATSQRITLYDDKGKVMPTTDATHVDAEPLGPNPEVAEIMRCRVYNPSAGKYLSWDSNNLCAATTPTTLSLIPEGKTFSLHFDEDSKGESLHIGSNGYWSKGSASALYIYRLTSDPTAASMTGELVEVPAYGQRYLIVGEKDGSYYALSNGLYNGGSSSQRMTRTKVTLTSVRTKLTLSKADENLVWTFINPVNVEYRVCLKSYANNRYLGYNQYNLSVQTAENVCRIISTDATQSQFALYVEGSGSETNGNYAYSSTEGRFSANGTQMPTFFYRVTEFGEDSIRAQLCNDPYLPGEYIVVAQNAKDNTAYYALTNSGYGSGTSYRLQGLLVKPFAGRVSIAASKRTAVWTICEPTPPTYGEPSFFSAFMGSMRYYYNTIDPGDMPVETPNIVQGMMVYVYPDRVEMYMKNYHLSGTFSGITVNPYLKPFITYRKVQDPDDLTPIDEVYSAPTSDNAPTFNLLGQKVTNAYRGIAIRGKRKSLRN